MFPLKLVNRTRKMISAEFIVTSLWQTPLLTDYMEQSLSGEANSSSACQKILCILWNLKVYDWMYKIPPAKIVIDDRSL